MKSDISRTTFDVRKHYIKVVMQQGRVQVDADWNEQADIFRHHMQTEGRDIIGTYGVPMQDGGFAVAFTPDNRDLVIYPGRLYIDGVLCELEPSTRVPVLHVDTKEKRVHLHSLEIDGQPLRVGQWVELLTNDVQQRKLVQILSRDEERRSLTFHTSIDDVSAQGLFLHPVLTYATQPDYPEPAYVKQNDETGLPEIALKAGPHLLLVYLDVWRRYIDALDDPHIREVALGGSDTATRVQIVAQVKIVPVVITDELERRIGEEKELEDEEQKLKALGPSSQNSRTAQRLQEILEHKNRLEREISAQLEVLSCNTDFAEWNELHQTSTGTLNARTTPTNIPGTPGYRRLENQLYRIEIHEGNAPHESHPEKVREATYKWAYDNASVIAAIEDVTGNRITVRQVGPNSGLSFKKGQWIEITDVHRELMGQSGQLLQIASIDPITSDILVEESVSTPDYSLHPKIRLWNGMGKIETTGNWIALDNTVEVRFFEGIYKRGDSWQIPARIATGDIEWTRRSDGTPIPQYPVTVRHHYARLAHVIRYKQMTVQDRRRHFPSLASDAMHILAINWRNDSVRSRDFLRHEGLYITLDSIPLAASITPSTFVVSVEPTLPGGGDSIFPMTGILRVEQNVLHWRWHGEREEGAIPELWDKLNILFRKSSGHLPRVRVMLKGNMLWGYRNDRIVYLDGETLAIPARQDDGKFRTGIQLPSGTGRQASTFESWFYLSQ